MVVYTKGYKKARKVKACVVQKELKFYDQKLIDATLTAATDATGGEHNPSATLLLNTVDQGDGQSDRDGRQMCMDSIHLFGHVTIPIALNQTVPHHAASVFIALILDKQTNGAVLDSEKVFVNAGGDVDTMIQPFRNLQFIKRFEVLDTVVINCPQQEMSYDGTNMEFGGYSIPFSMFKRLDHIVNFISATPSVVDIVDNSLQVIAWTNRTEGGALLSYVSRLRFRS